MTRSSPAVADAAAWARFDDVPAGSALLFDAPHEVLVATSPGQVRPLLAALSAATEAGAWAYGYLAYEAAPGLDEALVVRDAPDPGEVGRLPLAWFAVCRSPACVPLLAPVTSGRGAAAPYALGPWHPERDAEQHASQVASVRAAIEAGETYQANLTMRLRAGFEGDPLAWHADLVAAQAGAHHAYLSLPGQGASIVSASPETFFEVHDVPAREGGLGGGRLLLRPMKGTAARGRSVAEDDLAARLLRSSAKERAENLMIVDLLRNDASRVSEPASVTVEQLFNVERYPTVLQLVSQVSGRLRPGTSLVDVVAALFPCGSVTGAPKARTMALLAELETSRRGVYCGAIGWVAPPGAPRRARFSVAIRTAVVDLRAGVATYGAGGGITWGSVAAREHAEVAAKTAVVASGRAPAAAAGPQHDFDLLETMAHVPGTGLVDLDRHLLRLADSARYCGFALDTDHVRALLAEQVDPGRPARVRLALSRDGSARLTLGPPPPPPSAPLRLAVDDEPVDSASWWPRHKTSRRDPYDRRLARHAGGGGAWAPDRADDVLLLNERGEVCEATTANVAVHLDGRWWTPPVEVGCLPGVHRARLLAQGLLDLRSLTVDDLARAQGLALVSSLRGWRPARLLPGGSRR